MHPQDHPTSRNFTFDVLKDVAEAVEKYMINSAREICCLRMEQFIPDHPLTVLAYAAKHRYHDVCDQAASRTLALPLEVVKLAFEGQPHAFIAWVQYREGWTRLPYLPVTVPEYHQGGAAECTLWPPFYNKVVAEVSSDLRQVQRFSALVDEHASQLVNCTRCHKRAMAWKYSFRLRADGLAKFSAFI
ncbi:hypothetical protein AX14_013524 [Amanita brunnescens Koide BX004]|nr:hypothetical protein AX14_013524 [Amanita brunnescens Koide BX004]